MEAYGEEWIRVCAHITDRTDVQCRERWRNLQDNRTVGHQTWTKREDDALRSLVKTHGKEKWKEVAKELERRALGESKRKGRFAKRRRIKLTVGSQECIRRKNARIDILSWKELRRE